MGKHQAIVWNNAGPVYWRIYTSLGPNELKTKRSVNDIDMNDKECVCFSGDRKSFVLL